MMRSACLANVSGMMCLCLYEPCGARCLLGGSWEIITTSDLAYYPTYNPPPLYDLTGVTLTISRVITSVIDSYLVP